MQAQATQSAMEWPPRLSDYPLQHPYSPIKDLDAAEFLAKHPTWDGRGVTIALLDGNLDLLLPEFQTAYTIDGKTVPKIADYLNVTDPRDDGDINPQWVNMQETVSSSGGKVSFQGKTFTVPRDGTYRIGLFSERRFNMESNAAYIDQDVDRNGNPKGDDGLFGVLWDEATNDVWVDTNRDLSFADEKAMTDYIKRQDVGIFGKDDPKTPVRDCIGFAVQTDQKNKFVSINIGIYQHATEIMGSVVGNRLPNGRLQGVAPGARLVSVFYGVSNAHGLIEGLITAFRHPQVDLDRPRTVGGNRIVAVPPGRRDPPDQRRGPAPDRAVQEADVRSGGQRSGLRVRRRGRARTGCSERRRVSEQGELSLELGVGPRERRQHALGSAVARTERVRRVEARPHRPQRTDVHGSRIPQGRLVQRACISSPRVTRWTAAPQRPRRWRQEPPRSSSARPSRAVSPTTPPVSRRRSPAARATSLAWRLTSRATG